MSEDRTLEGLWKTARKGYLSPLEQLRAVAFRDAYKKCGVPKDKQGRKPGLLNAIAGKVVKAGGGHPCKEAIRQLLERVDNDPGWFPGKTDQVKFGPSPVLNGAKRRCIAASAMALKDADQEPTYASVVANCPQATLNPGTGKPVSRKRVYEVLKNDCYDNTPDLPWKHQARLQKTALTDQMKEKRLKWAILLLKAQRCTAAWIYRHVIWVDICNTVLPLSAKKATEQALARKGNRGWISDDAKMASRNLKGNVATLKQNSWDTSRVYWLPVLVRGKLHVEALPEGFPGETPEGAATLVEKLPGVLARRFPNASQPKVVMTDRGPGFFDAATGKITAEYKAALDAAGLRPFQGECAVDQPGRSGDALLHETAVSWLRERMLLTLPAEAWKEGREAYLTRLREACAKINEDCDVEALCHAFPQRLADLKAKKGDALKT